MRAWAEMFDAFLASWDAPAPTPPRTPTPTTSPTSTASPATTACATCSPRAASSCPRATRPTPPDADTVCGLGNRKNDAFNAVLARDGVTAYPGSVALLDAPARPAACRSRSSRRRPTPPPCSRAAGLADRFVTVVDGRGRRPSSGLPGKPAPDTFVHAADRARRHRAGASVVVEDAVSGRAGRAPPARFGLVIGVDRGAGADALDARPAPTSSSPTSASWSRREAPLSGHAVGPTRSTAAGSPSTRGAWSRAATDRDDLGVTETLFAVGNGYLGMRGNPEEGRDALRARHLRQRLPRDLADPARRGGLRLRPRPARPSSTSPTPS